MSSLSSPTLSPAGSSFFPKNDNLSSSPEAGTVGLPLSTVPTPVKRSPDIQPLSADLPSLPRLGEISVRGEHRFNAKRVKLLSKAQSAPIGMPSASQGAVEGGGNKSVAAELSVYHNAALQEIKQLIHQYSDFLNAANQAKQLTPERIQQYERSFEKEKGKIYGEFSVPETLQNKCNRIISDHFNNYLWFLSRKPELAGVIDSSIRERFIDYVNDNQHLARSMSG